MLPTTATIQQAVGCSAAVAARFTNPLREACARFEITTARRLAAFIAQVGHESGSFGRLVENLSYRADRIREIGNTAKPGTRWRSLVPRAEELAANPVALGNAAYGSRLGNGDEASGDGWRYRGRGLIQITGRANYEAISDALSRQEGAPDFALQPELLEQPLWACLAAGAFWHDHELNPLADRNEFDRITRIVNGAQTGAADRRARYARALAVFAAVKETA